MASAETVTSAAGSRPGSWTTWDTGPILSLGHDDVLLGEVMDRVPGVLATDAVHGELNGIAWPAVDTGDKPREQAKRVLAKEGLLAPQYVLTAAQRRQADAVRAEIIEICGPGGHRGESAAIVHARDVDLVLVVNDKAARDVARSADVGTACVADLVAELVELDAIGVADAVDLCADLERSRLHPGRRVSGSLDLIPMSDGPVVMTPAQWNQL